MFSIAASKGPKQSHVSLRLEELETRALPSSVQPLATFDTAFSTNWSGYAAETNLSSPASNAVTQVSGSWTVPTVTGKTNAYSSVWVGIDGYSSPSVEQIGTEQDTTKSGATRYYAWWEMYPNPSVLISSMTISPGDSISASVTYNSGFTLQITDNTTHQSFTTTQSSTAQRSSAEWIVEAPSSFSGILPLANFGTASISGAQATINGIKGAIDDSSWQNTSIDMVSRSGTVIAHTSGLADASSTSSFNVTFAGSSSGGGHGHGHGHGPIQAAEFFMPIQNFQVPATPEPIPNSMVGSRATSVGQNPIVSRINADAGLPSSSQAHENELGSTLGLQTWWDSAQLDTTGGIFVPDMRPSDDSL